MGKDFQNAMKMSSTTCFLAGLFFLVFAAFGPVDIRVVILFSALAIIQHLAALGSIVLRKADELKEMIALYGNRSDRANQETRHQELSNQASHATSEPAPGADSSAREG